MLRSTWACSVRSGNKQTEQRLGDTERVIDKFLAKQKSRRAKKEMDYVYFIAAGKVAIKIGMAWDPTDRLHSMRSYNHLELKLLGCVLGDETFENALHVKFFHLRRRGEWFGYRPELLAWIEEHTHSLEDDGVSPFRLRA
jgi:hypothetical protein